MKKITNKEIWRQGWGSNEKPYYAMLDFLIRDRKNKEDICEIIKKFDNSHVAYLISELGYESYPISKLCVLFEKENKGFKYFIIESFELFKSYIYRLDITDKEINSISFNIIEKLPENKPNSYAKIYVDFLNFLKKDIDDYSIDFNEENEKKKEKWVRLKEEFEESHTLLMIKELGENSPPVYILYDLFMHERLEGPFSFIYHVLKYYQEIE